MLNSVDFITGGEKKKKKTKLKKDALISKVLPNSCAAQAVKNRKLGFRVV